MVNPHAMLVCRKQIMPRQGSRDATIIVLTSPMWVWKVESALIDMAIDSPQVIIRMRAEAACTHKKMRQKKPVTPMHGAMAGIRSRTTKLGRE